MEEKIVDKLLETFKRHLQKTSEGLFYINPDNHDQINMAISILTVESNEKLSKSNDRNARAMNWLTGGLLFVGVVQIIVSLYK